MQQISHSGCVLRLLFEPVLQHPRTRLALAMLSRRHVHLCSPDTYDCMAVATWTRHCVFVARVIGYVVDATLGLRGL
jgi:hypothetical protein